MLLEFLYYLEQQSEGVDLDYNDAVVMLDLMFGQGDGFGSNWHVLDSPVWFTVGWQRHITETARGLSVGQLAQWPICLLL